MNEAECKAIVEEERCGATGVWPAMWTQELIEEGRRIGSVGNPARYRAEVGGDDPIATYEGSAYQVAAWLVGWCGGTNRWVDVYLGSEEPILVYVGGTRERGVWDTRCRTTARHDRDFSEALKLARAISPGVAS